MKLMQGGKHLVSEGEVISSNTSLCQAELHENKQCVCP